MADHMDRDDTLRNTSYLADADDGIQHGIDDDPNNDAAKGAAVGGIGGAVTGAIAGSMIGPAGAVIGAVVGGVAGAGLSGVAVAAVDQIDNDNNITGVGDGVQYEHDGELEAEDDDLVAERAYAGAVPGTQSAVYTDRDLAPGNDIPGIQTGGRTVDGTPDTRGIMEKTADAVTGDRYDDKTGKVVSDTGYGTTPTTYSTPMGTSDVGDVMPGNRIPGVQTGGHATDGTPDTRGMMEKAADTVTGDPVDDKTGKRV